MKILALDASTRSTGYAYFEDTRLRDKGCWVASSADLINRINKITKALKEFLTKHTDIDTIVLEEVRPDVSGTTNIKTHKALMYLQAAIVFLVHDNFSNIKIEYIYPNTWRKECKIPTGRGVKRDVLKAKDIEFAKRNYDYQEQNDDVADAICMGHAYVYMNKKEEELNW